jgi:hypothetical protein
MDEQRKKEKCQECGMIKRNYNDPWIEKFVIVSDNGCRNGTIRIQVDKSKKEALTQLLLDFFDMEFVKRETKPKTNAQTTETPQI